MFAVDSTINLFNQRDVVYKLVDTFFYISRGSTRGSVMSYRNQTFVEIKFNQHNINDLADFGYYLLTLKGVKDSNTTKVNFNNVFKTALQEFKNSDSHPDNSLYDIKTLVIFTHEETISSNQELHRLKEEFEQLEIKILVIGLAENLYIEKLAKLASSKGYVLIAQSSSDLINNTNLKAKIANLICRGKLTNSIQTTG